MTRSADIDLDWGDGTHRFRLAYGQLRELQEKTGCGPLRLLRRLAEDDWRVDDLWHILRLGLIGGGMAPVEALRLVRAYVEERPPLENTIPAQVVLAAALYGAPDEALGKAPPPMTATETAPSNSPPSTAPA